MKTGKFELTLNLEFSTSNAKNSYKKGSILLLPLDDDGVLKGTFWRRLYDQHALLKIEDVVVEAPKEVKQEPVTQEVNPETVREESKDKFKKKKKKNKDEEER